MIVISDILVAKKTNSWDEIEILKINKYPPSNKYPSFFVENLINALGIYLKHYSKTHGLILKTFPEQQLVGIS